ncbi:MAG: hypothetical protein Q9169_003501 [Polycauliona sp. 2 TL-2023]
MVKGTKNYLRERVRGVPMRFASPSSRIRRVQYIIQPLPPIRRVYHLSYWPRYWIQGNDCQELKLRPYVKVQSSTHGHPMPSISRLVPLLTWTHLYNSPTPSSSA